MSESAIMITCSVLQTLIFAVGMIVALTKGSQKRDVSINPGYVNQKEYDEAKLARDKQLHEMVVEMKENRESSERQQSIQRAGLYKKIDEVRVETKGDIDGIRKDVNHQVNRLLEAVGELRGEINSNK